MTLDPRPARQFLEALFGPVYLQRSGKIFIDVRFKGKTGGVQRKGFYASIDGLIADMPTWNPACDYWVGVAPRKNNQKGTKEDVLVWQAIFADLDWGTEGHAGNTPYLTKADAQAALDKFPLPPSIVVDSGGGFQAHWLLNPLESDLTKVERVLKGVKSILSGDPMNGASILRLPGGNNMKIPGKPRPVRLVRCEPAKVYALSEFSEIFSPGAPSPTIEIYPDDQLLPDPEENGLDYAAYGKAAFDGEMKILAETREGSEHRNIQLNKSAFKLGTLIGNSFGVDRDTVEAALYRMAISIGLGEVETRATIKSGLEAGMLKPRKLPEKKDARGEAKTEGEDETMPTVEAIGKRLKIPLKAIVRISGEPVETVFRLENGLEVAFNTVELLNQKRFRARILDACDRLPSKVASDEWEATVQDIVKAAQKLDSGAEGTDQGILRGRLGVYLAERVPERAHETKWWGDRPLLGDDGVFITIRNFSEYILRFYSEKVEIKALAKGLRRLGCTPGHRKKVKGANYIFWRIPVQLVPPRPKEENSPE